MQYMRCILFALQCFGFYFFFLCSISVQKPSFLCLLLNSSMAQLRFPLRRQSSLTPERRDLADDGVDYGLEALVPGVRLINMVNERDLDGIKELLDSGAAW